MKNNLIKQNTVSAINQMIHSSLVYSLGESTAKKKILVVGNSILRHGPCKEIGWERDWGMAASAPGKDFVHLLYEMLLQDGQDVYLRASQCADWEIKCLQENILEDFAGDRDFDADLIVFRLGENVAEENKPHFEAAMRKFVDYIAPRGKVLFTTCFWENPIVDKAIKTIAKERGEICIDCCFSKDEKNMAIGQFAHGGVAVHPSDAGMEAIAKAIFEQLEE